MQEYIPDQKLSQMVSIEKHQEIETPFDPAVFSFPQQLFHLLQIAENTNQGDTISWAQDGKSFTVHDPNGFEATLLVKYFQMKKYASFTRQLCAYGFSCVRQGRKPGLYYHPNFVRDDYNSCSHITRGSGKAYRKKSATYSGEKPSSVWEGDKTNASHLVANAPKVRTATSTPFFQPSLTTSGAVRAVQELQNNLEQATMSPTHSGEPALSDLTGGEPSRPGKSYCSPLRFDTSSNPTPFGLNASAYCDDHHQKSGSQGVGFQILPHEHRSSTTRYESSAGDASSLEPRSIQDMMEEPDLSWAKRNRGS